MHFITKNTLTGPWHVTSVHYSLPHLKPGFWYIMDILTGRSKKIGPIHGQAKMVKRTGKNYFDRAVMVAKERNEAFFRDHKEDLPMYMGMDPDLDKAIIKALSKGPGNANQRSDEVA
jgi:hypothetical protein